MVIGGEISWNKLYWCIAAWPSHGSCVMNQKSNENFNVPSRSCKMTADSLGLAIPGCKVPFSCWVIVAIAMLLPQSLDHLGLVQRLYGENHTRPSGPSPVLSNFSFVGWQETSQPTSSAFIWCICDLSQHRASYEFHQYVKDSDFPLAKPQELELSLQFLWTLLPGTERPNGNCGMGSIRSPMCFHLSFVSQGLAFQAPIITK